MDRQGGGPYMKSMDGPQIDFAQMFAEVAAIIAQIPQSGLLMMALVAMAVGWLGSLMVRRRIPLGGLIRGVSTLFLVGVLVTVVLQMARFDSRLDFAVPQMGLPGQVVEGGETRVPLAPDGHFWLRAELNGAEADFLVDTGATLTAVSSGVAEAAGLEPRTGGIPVRVQTANGTIGASLTTIDEMRFGNVSASGLDAVIAPNLGETNVIGMNLLSRLASWRVEDNVLILVPKEPAPVS